MVSLARFWNETFSCLPDFSAASRSAADRHVGVAAAVFAGLDLQVDGLAVVDLQLGAAGQIEPERQLHQRHRRAGVAGDTDVDQHDQLAGLGQHGGLLDRAFERRVAADAGAARSPAGLGRRVRRRVGLKRGWRRRGSGSRLGCGRVRLVFLALLRKRRLERGQRCGNQGCDGKSGGKLDCDLHWTAPGIRASRCAASAIKVKSFGGFLDRGALGLGLVAARACRSGPNSRTHWRACRDRDRSPAS